MGLETGTYIDDLVVTNPLGTDGKSQGDDHIRLVKSVLQNTFPNANRAFNLTQAAEFKDDTVTISIDTDAVAADLGKMVLINAASGNVAFNLPDPSTEALAGWMIFVRRIDSSGNNATVTSAGSATFDGSATFPLISQYYSIGFRSDGTNWQLLGLYSPQVAFKDQENVFTENQAIDVTGSPASLPLQSDLTSGDVAKITGLGNDAGGNPTTYGEVVVRAADATEGSEDGHVVVRSVAGSAEEDRLIVAKGIYTPGATLGDPGVGSINVAGAVQKNGLEYTPGWTRIPTVNVNSGSSVTLASSLPPDIDEIHIFPRIVETNSNNNRFVLRIGTGGVLEATGYQSVGQDASTASQSRTGYDLGFALSSNTQWDSGVFWSGTIFLNRISGNKWHCWAKGHNDTATLYEGAGYIDLSGPLDIVALTNSAGAGFQDAGTADMRWR